MLNTYASNLTERRKVSPITPVATSQLLALPIPEPEMPRYTFRRESLCSTCQKSYPSRFSDLCADCESEENPMFLYTIYESDEEDEEVHSNSPPASPGPDFRLDFSNLTPPKFSFNNYSSSVDSASTVFTDSMLPTPNFELADTLTPISTPGSFTIMMRERKGYIFEGPREPQDYFPAYLYPQSVDPEIKRSGPIKIPRSPSSDPNSIYMELDTINSGEEGPTSPHIVRPTSLRSFFTPK
ncbi:hypothetical protein AOL_s00078g584 [Orbilia oligospora ATCC 24927]|uniref:Uncharacterized protein n=2 Tax=Orbilia oligospora TaxID=2813651 RepID=G1XCD7_ARTOA|nr:hypothetical protein AOL_s00078g584 [Orbilia oligospora ATCC 24927]EGX49200.1 hypothetical protein AOL_s00078g584 [Orbilia oligospora ATCC 24927]KAF3288784.1 hypothetical protein TWF970_005839 [Orbilia oligospora]